MYAFDVEHIMDMHPALYTRADRKQAQSRTISERSLLWKGGRGTAAADKFGLSGWQPIYNLFKVNV